MALNPYLRWYQRVVWLGVTANMSFAVTALYAPAKLPRPCACGPSPERP